MKLTKNSLFLSFIAILTFSLFFIFFNYLNFNTSKNPLVFNSPDETANYFFIKNFKENTSLKVYNEYLTISPDIYPRSTNTSNNYLIPGSFIGMPIIYGTIAKIGGINSINYLTSIFALLSVIFFYLFIKNLFDKNIAILSSFLMLSSAPFWYWSSRAMMHNILFMFCFILFLFISSITIKKQKLIFYILSALILMLAIFVRSSEIVWIIPLIIFLLIILRKQINFKKLLISILIWTGFGIIIFIFKSDIINSFLNIGYFGNENFKNLTLLQKITTILLPFGFNIKNILSVIYNYIIKINTIYTILLFLSILYIFIRKHNRKIKIYLTSWLIISFILFIYYTSWRIMDNTTGVPTIGNSYSRYLLPFFIFSMPLLANLLINFAKSKKMLGVTILSFVLAVFMMNSYIIVMKTPGDGLIDMSYTINNYQNLNIQIQKNTDENSIIITDKSDKFIFPYRNVLYIGDKNINSYDISKFKNKNIPIYYFKNGGMIPNTNFEKIFESQNYYLYKTNLQ